MAVLVKLKMQFQFIFHDIIGVFFIEKFVFAQIKSRTFVMEIFSLVVAA